MKYGHTLAQRSPEWGHFNIDYDYLKDLIKHHTTAGSAKAVSIPGQGATTEIAFGDTFFRALKAQHDRITRFIRSKSGEIERRLEHIGKSLEHLQSRPVARDAAGRLPVRVIEKYAKIDADITKAGEEIRLLSSFQVTQRTGFRKILKKYKRWTRDRDLEHRFKHEVTSSEDSFYQLNLEHLLEQYIEVLGALRTSFDASGPSGRAAASGIASSPSSRISQSTQNGSEVDFDLALSLTPLGPRGTKATYWVHPDHVVETEVLLLQHMRLWSGPNVATVPSSPIASPRRRRSFATPDRYVGCEDAVGVVVLDHPESFAIKQNASTIGANEETSGTLQVKAAGNVQWTSSDDAAVVFNVEPQATKGIITAQLKRGELTSFLDTVSPFSRQPSTALQNQEVEGEDQLSRSSINAAREWLSSHPEVRPIAGICSRRKRFVGLHNNRSGGMWAILDRDVFTKPSLHEDLDKDNWLSEAHNESTAFPHAVLQIRREDTYSSVLISTLDRSHLVERVPGFSLEVHAVWACCKPEAMAPPIWIPTLDKDIRKLPPPVKRMRRQDSSSQISHLQVSTSGTSPTDSFSNPHTPRGDSSATSAPEYVDPPPLQAFRKKRRPYADYPPPVQAEQEGQQRYWNEYDNPESEDDAYYIYVDPDESVKFPGQETLEALMAKMKRLFGIRETDDKASVIDSAESSDGETVYEESPMSTVRGNLTIKRLPNHAANWLGSGYGTFSKFKKQDSSSAGYFSNLFRTIRDPQREYILRRETERERQSLLTELEIRQHKAEMTKLYFYSTCLLMATVMDLILTMMTMTSRRKERGVVDGIVLFGTVLNLCLCTIASFSAKTRMEVLGWVHRGLVGAVVVGNVVVDVGLILWVFGEV